MQCINRNPHANDTIFINFIFFHDMKKLPKLVAFRIQYKLVHHINVYWSTNLK